MIDSTSKLYYEDIEKGLKFRSPGGRTIDQAEVISYAQITGDFNLVHIDAEYAKSSLYGERIAHGDCLLVILSGIFRQTAFASQISQTAISLEGFSYIKYTSPVKFGDTVYLTVEVVDKSDNGDDTGNIYFAFNAFNQNDIKVLDSIWIYKIAKSTYQTADNN